MWLWPAIVAITIQFSGPYASSDATQLVLVAVNGHTTGLPMQRSNALNQYTILLNKTGQDVRFEFLTSTCDVAVSDVRYSNGGSGSDFCTISIDETFVGSFTTTVQRSPESFDPWNDFVSTGPVGSAKILSGGTHTLQVRATRVDPYGMELDYVRLSLECGGIRVATTSQDHNVITTSGIPVATTCVHLEYDVHHAPMTSQDHKVIMTSEILIPTTSVHPNNATPWRVPDNKPVKFNSKLSVNEITGICVALSIVLIVTAVAVSFAFIAANYYKKKHRRRYCGIYNDFNHGCGYIDYEGGNNDGIGFSLTST